MFDFGKYGRVKGGYEIADANDWFVFRIAGFTVFEFNCSFEQKYASIIFMGLWIEWGW